MRGSAALRDMLAEVTLRTEQLIAPLFVREGSSVRREIASMPGQFQLSVDTAMETVRRWSDLGLRAVLLFGIPDHKDASGSSAWDEQAAVQRLSRRIAEEVPGMVVITDVCLCEYTSHGHCGMVDGGNILNDPTLEILSRVALSHAESGSDMVAPSDMMDGRIGAIRAALDGGGFDDLPILAYSAKYSSAFYGPFREAAGSAPQFGDRSSYQMDCRNSLEAEKEVLLDIAEGADIVMVKPALSYLDVIYRTRALVNVPVCAYNVSGEFSMVKAIAKLGYGDEARLTKEIITSIFRAGADMIISYHTRDIFRNNWF